MAVWQPFASRDSELARRFPRAGEGGGAWLASASRACAATLRWAAGGAAELSVELSSGALLARVRLTHGGGDWDLALYEPAAGDAGGTAVVVAEVDQGEEEKERGDFGDADVEPSGEKDAERRRPDPWGSQDADARRDGERSPDREAPRRVSLALQLQGAAAWAEARALLAGQHDGSLRLVRARKRAGDGLWAELENVCALLEREEGTEGERTLQDWLERLGEEEREVRGEKGGKRGGGRGRGQLERWGGALRGRSEHRGEKRAGSKERSGRDRPRGAGRDDAVRSSSLAFLHLPPRVRAGRTGGTGEGQADSGGERGRRAS